MCVLIWREGKRQEGIVLVDSFPTEVTDPLFSPKKKTLKRGVRLSMQLRAWSHFMILCCDGL